MIIKNDIRPNKLLKSYISRYWSWESDDSRIYSLPLLAPGTGAELIFHYGDSFSVRNSNTVIPEAHLLSLRNRSIDLTESNNIGIFSVRFRAGMLRYFTNIPLGDLFDSFINIEDIWGIDGKVLQDKILNCDSFDKRVSITEDFLLTKLRNRFSENELIDFAVDKIYSLNGFNQLSDISEELNISTRHFQRIFKKHLGESPKSIFKKSRFEHTIKSLLITKESNYLDTALNYGYYDQSHFIKDMNQYLMKSPKDFFIEKNFMSHFYNNSIQ